MISIEDKKKINKVINVPINYFYLFIGSSICCFLSVIAYCYLDLLFLAIAFMLILLLIVISLRLQNKRERSIEEVIIHSLNNNKPILVEELSEVFVCISVSGASDKAKILRAKLNKLERLELVKCKWSYSQKSNSQPNQ